MILIIFEHLLSLPVIILRDLMTQILEFALQRPLSKECDDENDCKSEYSGSSNDFDNGKELSESNSEYSVITRGLSPPNIEVIFQCIT